MCKMSTPTHPSTHPPKGYNYYFFGSTYKWSSLPKISNCHNPEWTSQMHIVHHLCMLINSPVNVTLVGSHPVAMNFRKRLWICYNEYESISNHPNLHLVSSHFGEERSSLIPMPPLFLPSVCIHINTLSTCTLPYSHPLKEHRPLFSPRPST